MSYPPFTAVFFHPQFGPSYTTLHTIEEFRAVASAKNCSWAKLINNLDGAVLAERHNPSAMPEPIPSQESPE
ncbi:hypothetical protein [Microcystis phage Mel-JY34]